MIAATLPFELLTHISLFLSTKEKYTCSFVCKSWQAPFQESLWSLLVICSQVGLTSLFKLLSSNENILERTEDHHLQSTFQNIKYLDIRYDGVLVLDLWKSTNWNLWSNLTQMWITFNTLRAENQTEYFVNTMSYLPQLWRLYIKNASGKQVLNFTMQDLENLHDNLPRLRELTIVKPTILFRPEDCRHVNDVYPAKNLKVLKLLEVAKVHQQWIHYFSRKYCNLNTLIFKTTHFIELSNQQKEEYESISSDHNPSFPDLNTVEISCLNDLSKMHTPFFNTIRTPSPPLKRLKHTFDFSHDNSENIENTLKDYINTYLSTLETLLVNIVKFRRPPYTLADMFYPSPNIVELEVTAQYSDMALDKFLEKYVSLRKMRISEASILLTPDLLNKKPANTHPLRVIEINDAKANADALEYLSSHCKHLSYMRLSRVDIYGNQTQDARNLNIDMSHTHFKKLNLQLVKFYPFYDQSVVDHIFTFIAISPTSQDVKRRSISNRGDDSPVDNNMNNIDNLGLSVGSKWFSVTYSKGFRNSRKYFLTKLDESDAQCASQHFFSNKENPDPVNIVKEPWPPRLFKYTCYHTRISNSQAYCNFKYGSIDSFKFTFDGIRDQKIWDKIFKLN
ncbi:hypothetical protein PHYBLDRAFT_140720 [Phycomyces blakesleeanus NRRL 1555(-)]|uniref:F-box domain-containing protein n=1 Tax=Phycomyces blakesleeanus (strain ATCC 8743b / DSM 1359 / FGSC 10004 / NBRC 33097 / NRRL 1555) TaxID=763407 RepID=A0A163EHH0_PHYB8|nr:hypothetical protein PHYBLDRAFT_140720 [Phycomyces blakesleeanus NRRL 1555(-)]OAD78660.1 hypothetical protein PHYBLDRAFT_140720 [Phycomyces blakesleeanus NRRL 1555(-)]|eukprot:XP_018296700.1 hypothetical protein PHYBLDRAFT_140720 [Phycomyces blakesleeanus NRRL 1555(-)]